MQISMVGLGRMGANMVRRLLGAGYECVVYNRSPDPVKALVAEGAIGATSIADLIDKLEAPRAIWLMLPSGDVTEAMVQELGELLSPGDIVIDGGNTMFKDDARRGRCGPAAQHRPVCPGRRTPVARDSARLPDPLSR